MSAGDEMRVEKITFIPCIKPSLKTSLNSAPTEEQRRAERVLPLSLPDDVSKKPDPDHRPPAGTGQSTRQTSGPLRLSQAGDRCVAPLFKRGVGGGGRRVETRHAMEK